jgi:hypothetical protein
MGSDGELLWAARTHGTISSGYFVDDPMTTSVRFTPQGPVRNPDELQNKLLHALREDQAVLVLFRQQ